jgi:hypothetical protein
VDPGFTFVVRYLGKFNNDGFINGTIAATEPGALVRFGKNVYMADGGRVTADRVTIGSESSLFDVYTNQLNESFGVSVRGARVIPTPIPVADPPCEKCEDAIAPVCGGPAVMVPAGTSQTSLAPGIYGDLFIDDGAVLNLPDFGTYNFCSIRMDRYSQLRPSQQVTINVTRDVRIGAGAFLLTDSDLPFILNVGGTLVRISQGAVVNAVIRAPCAKIKIQRDGTVLGCTCSPILKTDKHVSLICAGG